jgi:hypothetical protein
MEHLVKIKKNYNSINYIIFEQNMDAVGSSSKAKSITKVYLEVDTLPIISF